jgi:adenosylcobinamide-GDP ribazoletransferase
MNIIAATAIAFSFLTIFPMPKVEWTPSRLRYFPLVLPLVGLIVGGLGATLFWALSYEETTNFLMLRVVSITLFYLFVTGGLHMDGLMDTCDAVFSRRDRKTRLEILSDTHVGAFAVMGCVVVLLLKTAIFFDLITSYSPLKQVLSQLIFVSVYSRIGLGILLYLPFARQDGLARTLGETRLRGGQFILIALYVLLCFAFAVFFELRSVIVPLTGAVFLCLYGFYCVKTFGGITGDLLGAFVELSEVLMLLTLSVCKMV